MGKGTRQQEIKQRRHRKAKRVKLRRKGLLPASARSVGTSGSAKK